MKMYQYTKQFKNESVIRLTTLNRIKSELERYYIDVELAIESLHDGIELQSKYAIYRATLLRKE